MSSVKYFILLAVAMMFSACSLKEADYQTNVKSFTAVTVADIEQKIADEESFTLYLGRESCPFCVEFVPLLVKATENSDQEILYIDTEKDNDALSNFRKEYDIQYVPYLAHFNLQNGNQQVTPLTMPTTQNDLAQFLTAP